MYTEINKVQSTSDSKQIHKDSNNWHFYKMRQNHPKSHTGFTEM